MADFLKQNIEKFDLMAICLELCLRVG